MDQWFESDDSVATGRAWLVDYPREGEPDYVRRYTGAHLLGESDPARDPELVADRLREACDL